MSRGIPRPGHRPPQATFCGICGKPLEFATNKEGDFVVIDESAYYCHRTGLNVCYDCFPKVEWTRAELEDLKWYGYRHRPIQNKIGFSTPEEATNHAQKLGKVVENNDPDYKQGPVLLPDGSWGYWTLHHKMGRITGEVLIRDGSLDGYDYEDFLFLNRPFSEIKRKNNK